MKANKSLGNFSKGNGFIPTSSLREILAALDDQLTNDQLNGRKNILSPAKLISLNLSPQK